MGTERESDTRLLRDPIRQSPMALLPMLIRNLRNLGIGQILIAVGFFVTGAAPPWATGMLPLAAVAFLAYVVAAWWRMTISVDGDELVMTRGVLNRDALNIPFSKVQSAVIEQRLLQRLFGLVSMSIDAAGNRNAEFEIDGIDRRYADALQRLVSEASEPVLAVRTDQSNLSTPAPPEGLSVPAVLLPPPEPIVAHKTLARRTPVELFVLGLLPNPLGGLLIVAGAPAVLGQLLDSAGIDGDAIRDRVEDQTTTLALTPKVVLLALLGLGTACSVLGLLLGIKAVITDWDQELAATHEGLVHSRGLFNQRSQASQLTKVQAIMTTQGPLRRRLGFYKTELFVIGEGDFKLSGLRSGEIDAVRGAIGLVQESSLDDRVSIHIVWQRLRLAAAAVLIVALALLVGDLAQTGQRLDWRLYALALVPLLSVVRPAFAYRNFRWNVSEIAVTRQTGAILLRKTEMPRSRLERVSITQSWYQQRRQLASLVITNAETALVLPMLSASQAASIRDHLLSPGFGSSRSQAFT